MLKIKLFAQAREIAGSAQVEIPWSDGETVLQLRQTLGELYPGLQPLMPRLLVAVNNDYCRDEATIKPSDEVACFPPVSGG